MKTGSKLLAHVHRAAVAALGRIESPLRNPNFARLEIDVLPLQAEGLPKAHSGASQEEEERMMPALLRGGVRLR